ncbi:MAG: DUF4339 domain-containing protein [Verrucomicrobia bacterium]|nr:DUF4339 domain-containing protein [Verrucomicrobiota bacterium]
MTETQQQQGQWRVKVAAGEFGPLDLETVKAWVQQRRILPRDLVYSPETGSWVPAGDVPQLAGRFAPGARTRSGRKGANVGLLIGVLVVIAVVAAGAYFVLLPALSAAREAARRASCLSNLKQCGLAMSQYTQDFHGLYPWREGAADPGEAWRDMGLIYPNYASAMQVFRCPSSNDQVFEPVSADGKRLREEPLNTFAGGSSKETISYSYGYARPLRDPARPWKSTDPASVRLLADKKAGIELSAQSPHGTYGRNVLHNDGHVRWQAGPEWLDPDETNDRIGRPDEKDYTRWWSDPPYFGQ